MISSIVMTPILLVLLLVLPVALVQQAEGASMRNATKRATGTIIPWPSQLQYLNGSPKNFFTLRPQDFRVVPDIDSMVSECAIVERALNRYAIMYFDDRKPEDKDDQRHNDGGLELGRLRELRLAGSPGSQFVCEYLPHADMDESYRLRVDKSDNETAIALLTANTSWGLIRGLETFSQLVYMRQFAEMFAISSLNINDKPRFPFRGYMLDTARHYVPIDTIMRLLDAMAHNKLNMFHWHLVDDQSFPLVSSRYPQLSSTTAFRPQMVYRKSDVSKVVDYATDLGIRVMAELDTPGHSYAMRSIQDLLAKCYDEKTAKPNGDFGPIDPTNKAWLKFFPNIVEELNESFFEKYFHAGGDEVEFDCWKSNPNINKWMADKNITAGDYKELSSLYLRQVHNILTKQFNKTVIVWQEVFDNGAQLPNDTIVHIWKDGSNYSEEMRRVLKAGYRALLSSCWYLNYIDYGQDWIKFYNCDPAPKDLFETDGSILDSYKKLKKDQILGGEICMWTEYVDETNVISRSWPRASAAAERLWSPRTQKDLGNFLHRLEQMRCRLRYRGINAEPVTGPGYC